MLNTIIARMRAYQPQAPSRNALPASDPTSVAKLPVLGSRERRDQLLCRYERQDKRDHDQPDPAADPSAARASWGAKPERLADRRPAERPLLAADEDRDENELPDETEVRHTISALNIGTMPLPANRSASAGAASQASAAIGSAAAAQTANIPGIRNCGISTLGTAVSARAVAGDGSVLFIWIILCCSI